MYHLYEELLGVSVRLISKEGYFFETTNLYVSITDHTMENSAGWSSWFSPSPLFLFHETCGSTQLLRNVLGLTQENILCLLILQYDSRYFLDLGMPLSSLRVPLHPNSAVPIKQRVCNQPSLCRYPSNPGVSIMEFNLKP